MATQLGLYNGALRLIGERKLASLTEDREPQRVLTDVWNDGFIDAVLEQGLWNFAMRAVKVSYNTSITPAFGYTRAFDKPVDFIRTAAVTEDEYFNSPLTRYVEETGYWFADLDTIYVRYVSNSSSFGNDLTLWPQSFTKYAVAYLAAEAVMTLTQDKDRQKTVHELMFLRRKEARSRDAMADPTSFLPQGSWSAARHNESPSRNDRGSRSQLIG